MLLAVLFSFGMLALPAMSTPPVLNHRTGIKQRDPLSVVRQDPARHNWHSRVNNPRCEMLFQSIHRTSSLPFAASIRPLHSVMVVTHARLLQDCIHPLTSIPLLEASRLQNPTRQFKSFAIPKDFGNIFHNVAADKTHSIEIKI